MRILAFAALFALGGLSLASVATSQTLNPPCQNTEFF